MGAFIVSNLLGQKLSGLVDPLSQTAVIAVYVSLILGFLTRSGLLVSGEVFIHEVGHALAASSIFKSVNRIYVNRDFSGVTYTSGRAARLRTIIVSPAGPLMSGMFFVLTARLVTLGLTSIWLIAMIVAATLITVTTIRNIWGWVTGAAIVGICYYLLSSGFTFNLDAQKLDSVSIWVSSSINAVICLTAFSVGIAIRYSLGNRFARNPSSDEYKFGKAIFLGPAVGGHLIFLLVLALAFLGLTFLLGWSSPLQFGRLI